MDHPEAVGRVSLPLQQLGEDIFEPDFVADGPLVRFVAYADCRRIFGWLHLNAARLTDLLNGCEELRLIDCGLENLADGSSRTVDEIVLPRDELVAVHASGPRGNDALRTRTRIHPIVIQAQSFLVGGHLHAPLGVEPMANIRQRPPMIPLTDAWIEYWSGGLRRRQWTGIVVVNRAQADMVRLVTEDDLAEGLIRRIEPIAAPVG